jgi:DNA-binding MarR family transcriptional regulator
MFRSRTLPVLPCGCANLRRAARAASQLYDEELRGTGLGIAQFTLLQVLVRVGPVTQSRLGRILVLDTTTLTRTLAPLARRGWIRREPEEDGRARRIVLTRAGLSRFRRALPAWNRAQDRLRRKVGRRGWTGLMAALTDLAGISSRP